MNTSNTQELVRLDGDRAVVTGGGSGLAQAISILFGAAGAEVLVVDQNAVGAEETAREIVDAGGTAEAVQLDVTDYDAVERVVGGFAEAGLSIVINGAGIVLRKGLLDTTPEEWARVVDINLAGYFNVLRVALPALERSGSGRIVQLASMNALIGNGYPAYTASKGGVLSLTRQLAAELGPRGIRINSISPGLIETPINRETLGQQQAIRDTAIGNTPLGRLGEPSDIATVALFLVSPMSKFITGIDVLVDGGLTSALHWGAVTDTLQSAHRGRETVR
jgi:NAD(P)-dependent dehydrogenase (short-subunit alcohol dehydrogenase family)